MSDGELTDSGSFTLTVNAVNDAPVANVVLGETDEDQSVSITLSGSDIDGDDLTFSLDTDASNGSVSIDGNIATYTPLANFNGNDSFIFIVSDGDLTDTQEVIVTVNPVNDAPVASDTSGTTDEDVSCLLYTSPSPRD